MSVVYKSILSVLLVAACAWGCSVAQGGSAPPEETAAEPAAELQPTAAAAAAPTDRARAEVVLSQEAAGQGPATVEAAGEEPRVSAAASAGEPAAKRHKRSAASGASAAAESLAPRSKPGVGASRFAIVGSGRASFLIDAPLEKIKGRWTRFDGELKVDAADLRETGGRVSMDLGDLRTHTFGDSGKDAKQTEHAKNWMEIGREVSSAVRAKYAQAVFSIERIERVEPERLDASMKAVATVAGTLTLHGIEAAKRVEVELRFEGSPDAPTGVEISTKKPLSVSLSRHQIKPRDLTGRFLAGALERVGQKIADRAQVSVSIQARRR